MLFSLLTPESELITNAAKHITPIYTGNAYENTEYTVIKKYINNSHLTKD
jgi:hypothetical protein